MANTPAGSGRPRPIPFERREVPEPDQRVLACESSVADACRALSRAVRLAPTAHREEIAAHRDLLDLLGRQLLREASGT
ncbi:MAG: hypothetical protein QM704_25440 [Anaeromyxobacteraceae bacterium]